MKIGVLNASVVSAALAASLTAAPVHAATNLFTNGSFEDGNFTGWTVLDKGVPPFGDNNPSVVGSVGGIAPEDGKFQASFMNPGPKIAQTITDTAGVQMAFTFWFQSSDGAELVVVVNGKSFPDLIFDGDTTYHEFRLTGGFKATGSETIEIDIGPDGSGSGFLVDNFSLTPEVSAVPEVPEATTWAMMLVGFASLGLVGALSGRGRRRPIRWFRAV
jgi:hypothetical protein